MTIDTRTCDACGTRYAFTSRTDRCPVCCPVDEPDFDPSDELELSGEVYDDD